MNKIESKSQLIDNGDGTVLDPKNGLMWMKSDTWVELGRLITWHESQEYAKEANQKEFGGYKNWRLPNGSEAMGLFDSETSNRDVEGAEIHIDPVFTSGCGFTTWTSETRGAKAAMGFDYRSAYEFWLAKENDGFPSAVRLVRANAQKTEDPDFVRFEKNADRTISDNETGLMWKEDDSFLEMDKWLTWDEAKTYIQNLNLNSFARYEDWRMPSRKELQTIYDPANLVTDKYGDTVFIADGFNPGCGLTSWSKTLHKSDRSLAIRFQFYNGDYKWNKKGLKSHGVRAVRDIKK